MGSRSAMDGRRKTVAAACWVTPDPLILSFPLTGNPDHDQDHYPQAQRRPAYASPGRHAEHSGTFRAE